MSVSLSKEFLTSLGIQLDDVTYAALSEHYDSTLSDRIIESIIDELDGMQLVELEGLRSSDSHTILRWLSDNIDNLDNVIEDEVAILLGEIAESYDKL